jgi:hypothetical protein
MGRLPEFWAGRKITMRIPYTMPGEINLVSSEAGKQFPDAQFQHNVDKPFEIHRCKPIVTSLDGSGVVNLTQPLQEVLQQLIRVRISDLGKNELITKAPALIASLVKGTAEATWEWAEPYTIVRSESMQIVADALALTNFAPTMASLRLAWTFQGFLLVIAPPSESR